VKLLVVGTGRMGTAVAELARARGHEVVALGVAENPGGAGLTAERVRGMDAAIEFTLPDAAPENLRRLMALGVPTVTGTTGWLAQLPAITAVVEQHHGALLHATNFSVGVQVFLRAARMLGGLMRGHEEFDAHITETHHRAKLDAPSGTGLSLQAALDQGDPERSLPITSIRTGHVVGEHQVVFDGPHDVITLSHSARDRAGFAEGAVLAAEWLPRHRGVFTFDAMLFGETA
jgi:4-hydroxy-tetrahydrodipicolinate reductase